MREQTYLYKAECPDCNGSGNIALDREIWNGREVCTLLICSKCNGTGEVLERAFVFEAPGMEEL